MFSLDLCRLHFPCLLAFLFSSVESLVLVGERSGWYGSREAQLILISPAHRPYPALSPTGQDWSRFSFLYRALRVPVTIKAEASGKIKERKNKITPAPAISKRRAKGKRKEARTR